MEKILVKGGTPLFGTVTVSGSKNAALPIIFATLTARGVSRLSRVPDILDVRVALELICSLGARVTRISDSLYIDTREIYFNPPNEALVSKIRASTYLIGAMLARLGRCPLGDFGGCNFSKRPIDLHILAAKAFGASLNGGELSLQSPHPAEISFAKPSVGATANSLIMASAIDGTSRIRGCALEPHIMALINFLRSMGAKISVNEGEITVIGGNLHGGSCEIVGDMIEAGSYLAMGLVSGGKICVKGCDTNQLESFAEFLRSVGALVEITDKGISAERAESCPASVTAAPYPAFPTDLQPIASVILASHSGGEVFDEVFPERFGYLDELSCFGLNSERREGSARIYPSVFRPASARSPDLRGGIACLLCALCAKGESEIYYPERILRGYELLEEKISSLGGKISFD